MVVTAAICSASACRVVSVRAQAQNAKVRSKKAGAAAGGPRLAEAALGPGLVGPNPARHGFQGFCIVVTVARKAEFGVVGAELRKLLQHVHHLARLRLVFCQRLPCCALPNNPAIESPLPLQTALAVFRFKAAVVAGGAAALLAAAPAVQAADLALVRICMGCGVWWLLMVSVVLRLECVPSQQVMLVC